MSDQEIYNEYYFARMPHPGYAVIENEILGDKVIVDSFGEVGKPHIIYVGSFSKFCFGMWGLRKDIVEAVCEHSLKKLHRKIERIVDLALIKQKLK